MFYSTCDRSFKIVVCRCCCRSWRDSVVHRARIAPTSAATWCDTFGTNTRRSRVLPVYRSWTLLVLPPRWPTTSTPGPGRSSSCTRDVDAADRGLRCCSRGPRRPTNAPPRRHFLAPLPSRPLRRLLTALSSFQRRKSPAAKLRMTGSRSTLSVKIISTNVGPDVTTTGRLKPKFHYADFRVTTSPRRTRDVPFSPHSITPTSPKLSPAKFRGGRRNEIWA